MGPRVRRGIGAGRPRGVPRSSPLCKAAPAPADTAPRRVAAPLVALAVASAVALATALGGSPVGAQEEGQDGEGGGALLLIMDASGSMNETDDAGVPLIRSAKQALNGVVDALPEGAQVGLRVYGHRVPNTDRARGCRDTELISPVGPLDKARMKAAIAGYGAKGWTPMGLSLQESAGDLPPEGHSTIVLVSDGEDTCGEPPPCEAAKGLASRGVDVKIETVGFFVRGNPGAAEEQLRCVAESTGGSYRVAEDAGELAEELEAVSARNVRTADIRGRAVEGAADPLEAPTLTPGRYTDAIVPGEKLHYAFELEEGQSATVESTVQGPSGQPEAVMYWSTNVLGPDLSPASDGFSGTRLETGQSASEVAEAEVAQGGEGTYYVEAEFNAGAEGEDPVEYPLELVIEVAGGAAQAAGTSAPTPPAERHTPAADAASPEEARAEPEEGTAAPAEPAAQEGGGPPSPTAIALVAAVVLVLLVVVSVPLVVLALVIFGLRRRARRRRDDFVGSSGDGGGSDGGDSDGGDDGDRS